MNKVNFSGLNSHTLLQQAIKIQNNTSIKSDDEKGHHFSLLTQKGLGRQVVFGAISKQDKKNIIAENLSIEIWGIVMKEGVGQTNVDYEKAKQLIDLAADRGCLHEAVKQRPYGGNNNVINAASCKNPVLLQKIITALQTTHPETLVELFPKNDGEMGEILISAYGYENLTNLNLIRKTLYKIAPDVLKTELYKDIESITINQIREWKKEIGWTEE